MALSISIQRLNICNTPIQTIRQHQSNTQNNKSTNQNFDCQLSFPTFILFHPDACPNCRKQDRHHYIAEVHGTYEWILKAKFYVGDQQHCISKDNHSLQCTIHTSFLYKHSDQQHIHQSSDQNTGK